MARRTTWLLSIVNYLWSFYIINNAGWWIVTKVFYCFHFLLAANSSVVTGFYCTTSILRVHPEYITRFFRARKTRHENFNLTSDSNKKNVILQFTDTSKPLVSIFNQFFAKRFLLIQLFKRKILHKLPVILYWIFFIPESFFSFLTSSLKIRANSKSESRLLAK